MQELLKNPILDQYPEVRKGMEKFLQTYPGPREHLTQEKLEQKEALTRLLAMLIEVNDPKHWANYEKYFKGVNQLPDEILRHSTLN